MLKMLLKLLVNSLLQFIINFELINGLKIECNFKTNPIIGCSQESQSICNNNTGFCECNRFGFPINFDDKYCLPMRDIDQKCYISDQCLKSSNPKLFCYYKDLNALQSNYSLIELNKSDAIKLFRMTDRRLEGNCGCAQHHYYDHHKYKCIHQNQSSASDPFDIGFDDQSKALLFECSLDIECKTFDENSYCESVNKMCVCNKGLVKNTDNRCTKIKALYERCHELDQCVDTNSYCHKELNLCVCSRGYLPDLQKQTCIKSKSLYDHCTQDRECNFNLGVCDPKRAKCVCGYHSIVLDNSMCAKKTNYGDVCHPLYGDIVCQSSGDHLVCNQYTNRCVCEDGYLFKDGKCKSININRFGFEDEFNDSENNKNPMTYIVLVFVTVFGLTFLVSVLIKMFRRRPTPRQLGLYSSNNRLNAINGNRDAVNSRPSAPPVYAESQNSLQLTRRDGSLTIDSRNTAVDNEEKPPSYEEATAGYVII